MTQEENVNQAVVCYGPNDYRLEKVAKPIAGEKELIIKVVGSGICAGDIKASHGADMFWAGNNPWLKAPVVPGHEFYGEIVEIGQDADIHFNVSMNDLIIPEQIIPCNKCMYCIKGQYWMCEVHNIYGFQKDFAEGGMAEYVKIYANSRVHKIPKQLTFKDAVLVEPMACAIHTVERATINLNDVVVLSGAGSLGLCMVQIIKLKTPKKIVVLDLDESRLEIAKKLGADVIINPTKKI